MIEAIPGAAFTAIVEDALPGLVGTIGVAIEDADNNVLSARTTTGIVESAPGIYVKDDLVAPSSTGTYLVIWDDGTNFASEELHVTAVAAFTVGGAGAATFINRSCTLIRRTEDGDEDDFENVGPDEALVQTLCEIQQIRRQEPAAEGDLSVTEWVVFFRAGEEVNSGDAVEVPDEGEFELVGAPWRARNPRTQAQSHVECTAKQTRGPGGGS